MSFSSPGIKNKQNRNLTLTNAMGAVSIDKFPATTTNADSQGGLLASLKLSGQPSSNQL